MNLLITTIGDYNHADVWQAGQMDFDIVLIDYRKEPTFKYPGIADRLKRIGEYDYYWMPDEDILLETSEINRLFRMMADHKLHLAQPSLEKSSRSFISWPQFEHDPAGPEIKPTDFVEVTCPCFSREALIKCLPIFHKSHSGWGLDLVWPKLINYLGMAIINGIVVQHTRPVMGGKLYAALKAKGITPGGEMKALKQEYGI